MSEPQIDTIAAELDKLVGSLEAKLADQKQLVQETQSELDRTKRAVRELTGQKGKPKAKSANCKPSPTRALVIETLEAVLRRKQVLPEAKLKATVEKLLVDANYSKSGYALRFREALADERFVDSPQGYCLQESVAAADSKSKAIPSA